ncbi:GNAT family N-acetyltransferase [Daejeonella oryzae]|uniref:GNAT family N-acetyltransferase n=1 Tax=Daejeonella oryzae TaxID=1122943 RepID=UPI001FDF06DF|nr:GNAT family protein [Daejeonella oryzae]
MVRYQLCTAMLLINFSPFPNLESDRIYLRQITPEDVNQVFEMRSDSETMRFIPRPLAKNRQDALNHIELITKGIMDNEYINWGIVLKGNEKITGMICLLRMQPENYRTEIGYILHPDFQGKGIMVEAVKLVIDYAFNVLKFHSLEAVIDPDNVASEKVLLKHSFVKEGYFKENTFYNGKFLDSVIYSLINPGKNN